MLTDLLPWFERTPLVANRCRKPGKLIFCPESKAIGRLSICRRLLVRELSRLRSRDLLCARGYSQNPGRPSRNLVWIFPDQAESGSSSSCAKCQVKCYVASNALRCVALQPRRAARLKLARKSMTVSDTKTIRTPAVAICSRFPQNTAGDFITTFARKIVV